MRTCVPDRSAARSRPLSVSDRGPSALDAEDAVRELPNLPLEDALQLAAALFEPIGLGRASADRRARRVGRARLPREASPAKVAKDG